MGENGKRLESFDIFGIAGIFKDWVFKDVVIPKDPIGYGIK